MSNKTDDLNDRTPKWFKDWHMLHFRPVRNRGLRNEKMTWLVIGTIIAASVIGNANLDLVTKVVQAFSG